MTHTILVVDDHEDAREGLSDLLQEEGFHVLQATNGVEAMNSLDLHAVDLLVTDILMPEMDGIELVRAVRKTHPEVQFVLVSGGGKLQSKSDFDYLSTGKDITGVEHVLRKPFQPRELIELVNQLLGS